jgi:two-component system, sensor histidine kinase and response regulator
MTKILVIEDEAAIREEVADWLQFEGYEVIEAENGRFGIQAAIQHQPDLIISDIRMPEMDGYTVLLEIRANPKSSHIPFIFLTASAARESFRKGMDLGADDYLTKPFSHSEIMNAVHSRLEKQTQMQHLAREQVELLEQSLEEERHKRQLRARMTAMFAHDFRNPLTVILSSAYLLKSYENDPEPERRQVKVEQIANSARQLMQMLDDMMLAIRLENGRFEYFPELTDISEQTESIVEEFRQAQGAAHHLTLDAEAHIALWTDARLVRQIVSNLLSNAIKYSPPGSDITVRLQKTDGMVALSVQDNGIGISEEDISLLFEPFHRSQTTKSVPGSGIGLVIVQQAVEFCGGTIDVTSKMNEGSTFTVQLPIV